MDTIWINLKEILSGKKALHKRYTYSTISFMGHSRTGKTSDASVSGNRQTGSDCDRPWGKSPGLFSVCSIMWKGLGSCRAMHKSKFSKWILIFAYHIACTFYFKNSIPNDVCVEILGRSELMSAVHFDLCSFLWMGKRDDT